MSTVPEDARTSAPPEPDLTPDEMVARAVAMRPDLIERQADAEARTYYSEEMHQKFLDAGFYRCYVPRRFGGYEKSVKRFANRLRPLWDVTLDEHGPEDQAGLEEGYRLFAGVHTHSWKKPLTPAMRTQALELLRGWASSTWNTGIAFGTVIKTENGSDQLS